MQLTPYLNFDGNTEEVFRFYEKAFQGKLGPINRFGDMPMPGVEMPDAAKSRVMHVRLDIPGGPSLMGSDIVPELGQKLVVGNNAYISIHPTSKAEADRLFAVLSEGGKVEMAMADQPWGDYWGAFSDRFGIQWMINYHEEK